MEIREIRKLIKDKNFRWETGSFFVDGVNMVKQALENNWKIKQVVMVPELMDNDYKRQIVAKIDPRLITRVEKKSYEKLATKDLIQGLGAVVEMKEGKVGEGVMVVLESPRSPGNVGTIMRTLLGLGVTELIVVPATDIYQPECVRASMGAIFGIRCDLAESTEDALAFCRLKGYEIVCFDRGEGAVSLKSQANTISRKQKLAIWFGTEGAGLSQTAKNAASKMMAIESSEKIESYNLAEAVSIGLYTLLSQ